MNTATETKPAVGQETAQAVLEIIRLHPEQHGQQTWEEHVSCGTTRCVGGWAQFLHYETVDVEFAPGRGRQLLGLDTVDAYRLFYGTSNSEAVHALEYVAKGDRIDWPAVFGYDPNDPTTYDDFDTYDDFAAAEMWRDVTS